MAMERENKKSFESSLKSIETENFLDRIFYRPIGYRIALLLSKTPITPNVVTIISIFVGVFAGILFYYQNIYINLIGFALLVVANILDCVDGQLARLTGIKSAAGRILDGLAGDLWFISIYISIALRLSADASHSFTWIIASLAGASNLIQSNVADFYKTAHLYFISPQKGAEFDTVAGVKAKYAAMPKEISKCLYLLYIYYTMLQAKVTPEMQNVLTRLNEKYGKDIPEDIRLKLRTLSLNMMPLFNITTFNGRSLAMLAGILFQTLWIYLFFEITVLNIVLFIAMNKYERSCKKLEV